MTKAGPTTREPLWHPLQTVEVAGWRLATAGIDGLADAAIADCLASRERPRRSPRLVFDANGQGLSLRETDRAYGDALAHADVVHADGGFLVTASRWAGARPIAERSPTTDMIHTFARRARDAGLSFYLLGGTEEVNAEVARRLQALYPGLEIAGRRNGYFGPDEVDAVIAELNATRPDIVWLGLGKPKEQVFAARHRDAIDAGWLVTCGGCFNYITGAYSRAPSWMQRANLEWLYRMVTSPRQLFWRYLTTTPHALWLTLMRTRPGRP